MRITAAVVLSIAWTVDAGAQIQSTMPPLQAQFIKVVEDARLQYKSAANDMAKGASRPNRARSLCELLRGKRVERWIGWVAQLTTNGDGRGVLSIRIAPDLYVQTWNNSLSDVMDKTLSSTRTAGSLLRLQASSRVTSLSSPAPSCLAPQTVSGSRASPCQGRSTARNLHSDSAA